MSDPDHRANARAALERLIVDVQDFPEPGIVFKDITGLLNDPAAMRLVTTALAVSGRDDADEVAVEVVAGMEARGFLFGPLVAAELGVGFVPVRKEGKLPRETVSASYTLEYGEATLEVHGDAFAPGARVLVIDDVLATGGTLEATCGLIESCGAQVHAAALLMELTFLPARERLGAVRVDTLLKI